MVLTSSVLLSACGAKNDTSNKEQQSSELNDSSTTVKEIGAILEGVLAEDAQETDSSDESIRLVLKDIQKIEDTENISASMTNDGVILNVPIEILSEESAIAKLVTGDKVQFQLSAMPMMTASIPPQIPGNSIVSVEKIK